MNRHRPRLAVVDVTRPVHVLRPAAGDFELMPALRPGLSVVPSLGRQCRGWAMRRMGRVEMAAAGLLATAVMVTGLASLPVDGSNAVRSARASVHCAPVPPTVVAGGTVLVSSGCG